MTNTTITYGSTMATGVFVPGGESPKPSGAPKALIATRAVQVKGGWLGQVTVAEEIVWESPVEEEGQAAEEAATEYLIDKLKGLLA